ncbi:MAG: hypothetical protein L0G85_00385 [Kocuria sp.]|nr:hypothetical protein [Kocuria sp.]
MVIGADGGLLPAPFIPEDGIVEMGPGERVDVLVDFSRYPRFRPPGDVGAA